MQPILLRFDLDVHEAYGLPYLLHSLYDLVSGSLGIDPYGDRSSARRVQSLQVGIEPHCFNVRAFRWKTICGHTLEH